MEDKQLLKYAHVESFNRKTFLHDYEMSRVNNWYVRSSVQDIKLRSVQFQ